MNPKPFLRIMIPTISTGREPWDPTNGNHLSGSVGTSFARLGGTGRKQGTPFSHESWPSRIRVESWTHHLESSSRILQKQSFEGYIFARGFLGSQLVLLLEVTAVTFRWIYRMQSVQNHAGRIVFWERSPARLVWNLIWVQSGPLPATCSVIITACMRVKAPVTHRFGHL